MPHSGFMEVLNLIQNIPDAHTAKANSSFFALVGQLCVGMGNVSLLVRPVDRLAKFLQYHQLTFTEEDSKYYGRTKERR